MGLGLIRGFEILVKRLIMVMLYCRDRCMGSVRCNHLLVLGPGLGSRQHWVRMVEKIGQVFIK